MTAHPWERRRAEAFADALDGHATGEHELDSATVHVVRVAEALCQAGVTAPRPEFVQALRTQLVSEAATASAPQTTVRQVEHQLPAPYSHRAKPRRRLGALAATFALIGGSFGLITQSAQAQPGDLLYPIKRGIENVDVALTHDDFTTGSDRLDIAQKRVAEVAALSAGNETDSRVVKLTTQTLDAFSEQAEQGANALFQSYNNNGNTDAIDAVTSFTRSSSKTLAVLSESLPESASDSYAAAAKTLIKLNIRAGQLCSGCQVQPLTDLPRSLPEQHQISAMSKNTPKKPSTQDVLQASPHNTGPDDKKHKQDSKNAPPPASSTTPSQPDNSNPPNGSEQQSPKSSSKHTPAPDTPKTPDSQKSSDTDEKPPDPDVTGLVKPDQDDTSTEGKDTNDTGKDDRGPIVRFLDALTGDRVSGR